MRQSRLVLVLGALVTPLVSALIAAAPAQADATPAFPAGDIAGFTVTPGSGRVTQASLNVVVPAAQTSPDCNADNFEYSIFGLRFDDNTLADVSSNCGNSGSVAYFCDIRVGSNVKIVVLQPGERVSLSMSVSGAITTIRLSGRHFRTVSGSAPAFSSVGVGGWDLPGHQIPVLTTQAKFSAAQVNNTPLANTSFVETSLSNGTHVLMRPTPLNGTMAFSVKYVQQS